MDSTCVISSPNPTFDHLLESSQRDDSNKWSIIGFSEEITQVVSIEVTFSFLSGTLPNVTRIEETSYLMSCH